MGEYPFLDRHVRRRLKQWNELVLIWLRVLSDPEIEPLLKHNDFRIAYEIARDKRIQAERESRERASEPDRVISLPGDGRLGPRPTLADYKEAEATALRAERRAYNNERTLLDFRTMRVPAYP